MTRTIYDFATGQTQTVNLTPEEIAADEAAAAAYAAELAARPRRWTSLAFIELFTEAEQLAIVSASLASPQMKLWYDKAMAADFINADDPRTVAGMETLVAAGLLTPQRKVEILGS